MKVLGIESSCDETGVALVELGPGDKAPKLLAQALYSQVRMHEDYGGVVPELASRDHLQRLIPLLETTLREAHASLEDADVLAYTKGPGLAGALLVGAGACCALAMALDKPVLGVHHLEGHLLSPFLADEAPAFPFVALLVSGGHTQLMRVDGVGRYALLGETIDDAAGEAFDKSAKLLGLGYPGGPALSRLAAFGDAGAFRLPRPLLEDGTLDFSFAGLKTAVMTQWRKLAATNVCEQDRANLAAATQEAIVDVLVSKSMRALERARLRCLVVAGGVGANARLRERLVAHAARINARVLFAPLALCTDNGAMIAAAAAMRIAHAGAEATRGYAFDVRPRWPLAEGSEQDEATTALARGRPSITIS